MASVLSSHLANVHPALLALAAVPFLFISFVFYIIAQRPSLPKNAPPQAPGQLPFIGAYSFFTERWDWFKQASKASRNGNFSFYVGNHPVIGLSGEASRKVFFESRDLAFAEGYTTLLAAGSEVAETTPATEDGEKSAHFGSFFNRRLITMLKGTVLKKRLPLLLSDTRALFDQLVRDKATVTEPFDSIYRMVFRLTMRTVACDEISDDPDLLDQCLRNFETIDASATAWNIMYPWLPSLGKAKRTYAGIQLYNIFKKVIDDRKKHNRTEEDAVQYMVDQGDTVVDIISFVLGALFAGQLNSGINAAALICYIARDPYWYNQIRTEVLSVADRYAPGSTLPLPERLMAVPLEAWESGFPIVDLCLKESIRLNTSGAGFRQNLSGHDVPLDKAGKEVIPAGAYVAFAQGDTSYNPRIYTNPDQFDPHRYTRGEADKEAYSWTGWGAGRHPCLGMRFAKLEMSMIISFFIAYFEDLKLTEQDGRPTDRLPLPDKNNYTAKKPEGRFWVTFKPTKDVAVSA